MKQAGLPLLAYLASLYYVHQVMVSVTVSWFATFVQCSTALSSLYCIFSSDRFLLRKISCQGLWMIARKTIGLPGRPRGSPVQYTFTCNTGDLVLYGRPSRSPWPSFTDPGTCTHISL